MGLSPR